MSGIDSQSTPPIAVRLPPGDEQPVSVEIVRVLVLAGAAARRDGRSEVGVADLIAVLGARLPGGAAASSGEAERVEGVNAAQVASVTPYRDGPYLLRGAFELTDQDGEVIEVHRSTVALCRCGRSQVRPFCDGTHKLVGFQAESGVESASATDEA